MSSKKEITNKSSTKKRCPNGSRRDKKTDICVKYATIKTFENLSEQTISETKNTLSLESLGKDGTIMKIYKKGELQHQVFVNDENLQKAKKKAQKDIQKMLKLMHKIQKDPSKIEKDIKFKRMLKKIKGGGSSTVESNTDILIQEDVMEKIETKAVVKLEDKIENIETKNDKSWFWGGICSHWEAIMTIIHVADVGGLAYMAGHFSQSFFIVSPDIVGAMAIVIMNIWYAYYPEEENKQYTLYTQYLIYSFMLTSAFFVTSVGIIPNYIVISIISSMGLVNTIVEQMKLNTTNEKLEDMKRELVDVLENPQ